MRQLDVNRAVPRWTIAAAALLAWGAALPADAQPTDEWPRTDFSKRTVPLEEIRSGGPPKDGIPAIDRPRFVTPDEAGRWLDRREPVIVFERYGDARAYPLQILMFHEIVNDTVGGAAVAVTFCPLCNASIVFDRVVKGAVLDFGTTGKLRKSDLVMYDRRTESWWQQFTGKGIVGRYAGIELKQLPATITTFADFRKAYPQGRVLSRQTGFSRPYGKNPYRGYDRVGDMPFLFSDPVDPRLPAMERVLGVSSGGRSRIYPFAALAALRVVNDQIGTDPIAVFTVEGMLSALDAEVIRDSRRIPAAAAYSRRSGARTLSFESRGEGIFDRETGSEWDIFGRAIAGPLRGQRLKPADSGVHFAFAWLAFNPQSEIFSPAAASTPARR
ncbi:MAG: DUF3179 domain-containing protein [Betaproteobacteria bacterium]|nr:DUF3179 domain-containing protein [Betaproteobacteria bacterium]